MAGMPPHTFLVPIIATAYLTASDTHTFLNLLIAIAYLTKAFVGPGSTW